MKPCILCPVSITSPEAYLEHATSHIEPDSTVICPVCKHKITSQVSVLQGCCCCCCCCCCCSCSCSILRNYAFLWRRVNLHTALFCRLSWSFTPSFTCLRNQLCAVPHARRSVHTSYTFLLL